MLDQVRKVIRLKPEQSYVHHVQKIILFRNKRHPQKMGVDEIRVYLSHLQVLACTLAQRSQQLPRRQR